MKFLINIEAQKSSEPGRLGYHLQNRIIFYMARMISAQKHAEFFGIDYDGLKKVRSIWICFAHGENMKDSSNELISMLEELFSRIDVAEKKRILAEEYGMIMTAELEGRVQTMCNWSEHFIEKGLEEGMEKGMKKGMEKGMEQGIKQGFEKGTRQAILDLLENIGIVPEDIRNRIFDETDMETLRKWLKAARIENFECFRKSIL